MYLRGAPISKVCNHFGVGPKAVRSIVEAHGYEVRSIGTQRSLSIAREENKVYPNDPTPEEIQAMTEELRKHRAHVPPVRDRKRVNLSNVYHDRNTAHDLRCIADEA